MHGSLVAILISVAPQIPKGLALTLFVCSHKLVMVPKTIKKLLLENDPGVMIKYHYFRIKVAVHPLQPKPWSHKRRHEKNQISKLEKLNRSHRMILFSALNGGQHFSRQYLDLDLRKIWFFLNS